jgi:HD-GYP domain-containing protein (c-di-GMP phosphodiesterase class II)
VSERPYKKPWTHEEAVAEIEKCAGSHFDPDLARTFVALMRGDLELRARAPQADGAGERTPATV